ncbi:MAG: DUF992 domain-containing protein [Roseiarcus sp.]
MSLRALFSVAALAAAIGATQPAAPQERPKVGALRCEVSSGFGLILTSAKEMRCIFVSARGYSERYFGMIRKFGLDVGRTNRGVLAWQVFAPMHGPRRGALAGDYVGVAASATVGAGVGANALVGGSARSITLQPLSIQTQTGLALAAGVESLTLRAER